MGRMKIQNTPAIRRMPTYLHKLFAMKQEGYTYVSTTVLAQYMNIEPIVVRKDIALTGISGLRRVGYEINELIEYIKNFLGWQHTVNACLVGAGSLGSALLGYQDFESYGLNISSVFDQDANKIGTSIHGHQVLDIYTAPRVLKSHPCEMAIICVSTRAAQAVADMLVGLGIQNFWNFANVCLKVPPNVIVQREVIAGGFATLSVKMKSVRNGERPAMEE